MTRPQVSPQQAVAHLQPAVWAEVNRALVAKAIREFAHERLIEPTFARAEDNWGHYVLTTDRPDVTYEFRAQVLRLEHWLIDANSIHKFEHARPAALDAQRLVVELRERLAISEDVLPEYLQELASTLYSAAYKRAYPRLGADALALAEFQTIETAMTEGHPIFVANNSRIGFSSVDYPAYAPEAAASVALIWLAAHKRKADFACTRDHAYATLMHEELGANGCANFARVLRERSLDPDDYVLIPVHPWQWENRLAQLFAADIANAELVYLGPGEDRYLAQQSIRTFFNISRPNKRYVKTALSILNMGFTRGLPSSLANGAMEVNDWVADLVDQDEYLQASNFSLLREVAFVGYRHRSYEAAIDKRSDPYKEMLGALWRESPIARLRGRQRVMTMAALMHRDADGVALMPALIRSSGLCVDDWLKRYLQHYLKPLVHCFYAHHLVFTPHCENTLLVLEDHAVVGVLIKDLAEDIGVLNPVVELPERVRRLALRVPEDTMTLAIFTDVFDCVFRFLAQILYEHVQYPEAKFWQRVAECIQDYEREQPQYATEFERYDLFAPTFMRNCLNRLQLRNNRQMVDLNAPDPIDSLQLIGTFQNPIAAFGLRELSPRPRKECHDNA